MTEHKIKISSILGCNFPGSPLDLCKGPKLKRNMWAAVGLLKCIQESPQKKLNIAG